MSTETRSRFASLGIGVRVSTAGGVASLVLIVGEWTGLGSFRAAVAISLLAISGLAAGYAVVAIERGAGARGLGALVFFGTVAAALLSSVVVPPGQALPPPLWPAAVAAATVVGLRAGPSYGLAAGAMAGSVPVVSAALSVTVLTPELSALHTALVLASVAPPMLAGALRPGPLTPGPPRPGSLPSPAEEPEHEGRASEEPRAGAQTRPARPGP